MNKPCHHSPCATGAASYHHASNPTGVTMTVDEVVRAVREGRDLSGENLSGLDFSGQDLRGAKFSGADLSECNFRNADLRGADLSEANLYKADFRGAKLRRANLARANRTLARFRKWALKGAYIAGPTAYVD